MRYLLALLLIIVPSIAKGQAIVFPATLTVEFTPSTEHSSLLRYEMELVGTPPVTGNPFIIPLTACTVSLCSHNFTIPNMGPWALTLYAVSSWGRSTPAIINFAARNPEPAKIIKVKLATP